MTIMADSPHIIPPSKPRHYIIVVHGMGEQKLNETVPPVVQRFAEVRQNRKEQFYDIMLPASLSSQSVRSDSELHGWSEFRGIPVDDKQSFEDFDGTPPTDTAGENFRFVELYWQDILQRHQSKFASKTEVWSSSIKICIQNRSVVKGTAGSSERSRYYTSGVVTCMGITNAPFNY